MRWAFYFVWWRCGGGQASTESLCGGSLTIQLPGYIKTPFVNRGMVATVDGKWHRQSSWQHVRNLFCSSKTWRRHIDKTSDVDVRYPAEGAVDPSTSINPKPPIIAIDFDHAESRERCHKREPDTTHTRRHIREHTNRHSWIIARDEIKRHDSFRMIVYEVQMDTFRCL